MTYEIRTDGATARLSAATLAEAVEEAQEWLAEGWEPEESTSWVHGILAQLDADGEVADTQTVTIAVQPVEPECREDMEHDWQTPVEIVGGLKENPGVYGHGGGVTIQEVCLRCGCGKLTDTWAQDPTTGRQGLESVTYEPDKYEIMEDE